MAVTKVRTEKELAESRTAKAALAAKGWSYRELAERIGSTEGVVKLIMNGFYDAWPAKAAVNAALGSNIFSELKPERTFTPSNRMLSRSNVVTK